MLRITLFLFIVAAALTSNAQIITTFAGTGVCCFGGDGGPAIAAKLVVVSDVVIDKRHNVYATDASNNRIRRIDSVTGIITTIAGEGSYGYGGDGGPAVLAKMQDPTGLAIDTSGNLYIADYNNNRIRKIDAATGIINTVAGDGTNTFGGDGGPATSAGIIKPTGVAVDKNGDIYIADYGNNRVRKVTAATGIITTIAGTGTGFFWGDGGPATSAGLYEPYGICLDTNRNVLIADYANNRIRKIDAATGIITTIAGISTQGFNGNNILATTAQLIAPTGVRVDKDNNIYIADLTQRIRKIDANTGIITTVAGSGNAAFYGDGGLAVNAGLFNPWNMSIDTNGDIYIADLGNSRVRKVSACPQAFITAQPISDTVCGNGNAGFSVQATNATNYQWQINTGAAWQNIVDDVVYSGTTTNSLAITAPGSSFDNYQYRCQLTNTCGNMYSTAAVLKVLIIAAPSVSISTPANPVCSGTATTFTATQTNGGSMPVYQWQVNGINTGSNTASYNSSALSDGDIVKCQLVSNAACISQTTAVSNSLTMQVIQSVVPSVSITGTAAAICSGNTVSFTASVTNGGNAPSYVWLLNGMPTMNSGNAYTSDSLNDSDKVQCVLNSNAACALPLSDSSNIITTTVTPITSPSVSISSSLNNICEGTLVNFIAAPVNEGSTPVYQWLLNGNHTGVNSSSYSSNTLSNNDVVQCVLTSNKACISKTKDSSAQLIMTVIPVVTPGITVVASANPVCSGIPVNFLTTVTDGGANPAFQWHLNGSNIGHGINSFSSSTLKDGDVVDCSLTSSLACTATVPSVNKITMMVNPAPTVTFEPDTIFLQSTSVQLSPVVEGVINNYQWSPSFNLDDPTVINPVATPGETTTYELIVTTDKACAASGKITVSYFFPLLMPNAFSPNTGNINNVFRVPPKVQLKLLQLAIFNRYGDLVFETSNINKGWDGNYKGQPAATGAYVYIVKGTKPNGVLVMLKGTVMLLR